MSDSSTIQINIQIPENFQSLLQSLVDAIQNGATGHVTPTPKNDLMTVDDLAARWGKTRSAIYQLTMQKGPGSIPRFKVGGRCGSGCLKSSDGSSNRRGNDRRTQDRIANHRHLCYRHEKGRKRA